VHKRFKILVVDDEPINYRIFNYALKDEYDIFAAENGCDAITQARELMPDLILLKERSDLVKEQRDQLARQKVELEAALSRVKLLEGIIPICMHCKKI